jgi:hypothetical protein
MRALDEAAVEFLIGGAYALHRYADVERHTKDLDVFVRPGDIRAALGALAAAGLRTELTFPHWLGKAHRGDDFVDVIFSAGNGEAPVDDEWFANATADEVLGVPARLAPVEEMIWQKAYIQERERYDGADIAHLIRARSQTLDWQRLVRRFGPHWRVLLAQLVLFGFIYPGERHLVPDWVMYGLATRLQAETAAPSPEVRACQGTLLSREQYLPDVERWGYRDPRRQPEGPLTPDDLARWTRAIVEQPSPPPGHVIVPDLDDQNETERGGSPVMHITSRINEDD